MPDDRFLSARGRGLEEEYFRKRDNDLIEKIRAKRADDDARRELGEKAGFDDPELIEQLRELGFTIDTVTLLPLVPVVQMAWAEGGVTDAERDLVVRLARARGIEVGSPADAQLGEWLKQRPADSVFTHAGRLIRAMLASGSESTGALTAADLIKYCESIAAASGGLFGLGRVSSEERALLSVIAADLGSKRP
jgi:hypothetical protein